VGGSPAVLRVGSPEEPASFGSFVVSTIFPTPISQDVKFEAFAGEFFRIAPKTILSGRSKYYLTSGPLATAIRDQLRKNSNLPEPLKNLLVHSDPIEFSITP